MGTTAHRSRPVSDAMEHRSAYHTTGSKVSALVWHQMPDSSWHWRLPSICEIEQLMGFPRDFTNVPLDSEPSSSSKSHKLASEGRWKMMANTWQLNCLRSFAIAVLWSSGVRVTTMEFAPCNLYMPSGLITTAMLQPCPVHALHGLEGETFIHAYIRCLDPELARIAIDFSSLFDAPQSELNEFESWRRALGLATSGCWQPDLMEAECAHVLRAAHSHQSGSHLIRGGVPRFIDHGLGKLGHRSQALALQSSPFDAAAPLCLSSRFAVEKCIALGASINEVRTAIILRLRRKARSLRTLSARLRELMPPTVARVSGHVHVGFQLYLMCLMGWPDPDFITGTVRGLKVTGILPSPC